MINKANITLLIQIALGVMCVVLIMREPKQVYPVSTQKTIERRIEGKETLIKEGPLLQKTLQNRRNRDRGEDKSLYFEVIQPHPLLKISFEHFKPISSCL
jgi:hypothetical protein